MGSRAVQVMSVCMFTLGLISTAGAGPDYEIWATGHIVEQNTKGTLGDQVGRNFNYHALFNLNVDPALSHLDLSGNVVYELYDGQGGSVYRSSAVIHDGSDVASGDTYSANSVFLAFEDNASENWQSNSGLSFLNTDAPDGTEFDFIELIFHDEAPDSDIEFAMTLAFDKDLFTGEGVDQLPMTIDQGGIKLAAGIFTDWGVEDRENGSAQFLVETIDIFDLSQVSENQTPTGTSTVPAPGALLLAGLGTGLVGYMRRRRNL